jgi:hypothetical protein
VFTRATCVAAIRWLREAAQTARGKILISESDRQFNADALSRVIAAACDSERPPM